MIHFEQLWEQAESLQNDSVENSVSDIRQILDALQFGNPECREYNMGMLIMELCNISKQLNVNTYAALQKAIVDKKSEMLDTKL